MKIETLSYSIYLICLVFAPLAFGCVEKWSASILEILTVASLLLYLVGVFRSKGDMYRCIGARPLIFFLILFLVQLVPVPVYLLKFIAPATYEMYRPVAEVMHETLWATLSLLPQNTFLELLRFTTYLAVYFLTIQLLANNPNRLKFTLRFMVFLGAFVAFMGIIQKVSFPGKVLGLRAAPLSSTPFGPWVNANQFAGFMEILLPLAFALFLFYRPLIRSDESWRERFVSVVTMPGIHLYLYLGLSALVMFLAVFYSLCRGGILSVIFASGIFAYLHRKRFPKDGRKMVPVFSLLALGAVSWLGWDVVFSEFATGITEQGTFYDGRTTLWRDTVAIFRDYPLLGAGFGSFVGLYPQYKTISNDLIYDHAHNDYLELFTDGGIVAFALTAWFLAILIHHLWKMVKIRRDHFAVLIGLGALCGLAAILAHAVTDFNLHNMAVGYYAFILCGIGVATVNCRVSYTSPGTLLSSYKAPGGKILLAGAAGLGLFILVGNSLYFGALANFRKVEHVYLTHNLAAEYLQGIKEKLSSAALFFPLEGLYFYKLGSVQWFSGEQRQATDNFLKAASINPLEGIYLQKVGLLQEDHVVAGQLVAEGYRRALSKNELIFGYVEWLLSRGQRAAAVELLRGRIIDVPRILGQLIPLLEGYGFTRNEIAEILPRTARTWLAFGLYCDRHHKDEEAAFYYKGATDLVLDEPPESFDPAILLKLVNYYNRHDEKDFAVQLVRYGVEKNPDYSEYHVLLGQYYEDRGIMYRAREEFEKALILDPSNKNVLKRLRRLGGGDSY